METSLTSGRSSFEGNDVRGRHRGTTIVRTCPGMVPGFKDLRPAASVGRCCKLVLAHESSQVPAGYLSQTSPSDLVVGGSRKKRPKFQPFRTVVPRLSFISYHPVAPAFIHESGPLVFRGCVTRQLLLFFVWRWKTGAGYRGMNFRIGGCNVATPRSKLISD